MVDVMEGKAPIHQGLTELQEMKLEMLRRVLWHVIILPLAIIAGLGLSAILVAWFVVGFLTPLLSR